MLDVRTYTRLGESLTREPDEVKDGVPLSHYRQVLTGYAAELVEQGALPDPQAKLPNTADYWIDDQGRYRRIDVYIATTKGQYFETLTLADFGAAPPIVAP